MSRAPILYTVKASTIDGLRAAIEDLDVELGEGVGDVVLTPLRGRDYSIRTLSEEGTEEAIESMGSVDQAVIRVRGGEQA